MLYEHFYESNFKYYFITKTSEYEIKMKDKNSHLRRNLNVSTEQAKKMKSRYTKILAAYMENVTTHFIQLRMQ